MSPDWTELSKQLVEKLRSVTMLLTRSRGMSRWRSHSVTMFWTRSRGRGKITVEFFSALMLFKVWVRSVVRIVTIVVRNMELWQCNGCDDHGKRV